jgi:3D-(3,5/4)-trihydroxycyclohexane-1,2-dione acylhydrolase (decyclizing)
MKTDGYEWLEGTAFWESPTLQVDNSEGKKSALNEFLEGKNKQRKGV